MLEVVFFPWCQSKPKKIGWCEIVVARPKCTWKFLFSTIEASELPDYFSSILLVHLSVLHTLALLTKKENPWEWVQWNGDYTKKFALDVTSLNHYMMP